MAWGGCLREWLGDGVCDDACFVRECSWDLSDCSKAVRLERYVTAAECSWDLRSASCRIVQRRMTDGEHYAVGPPLARVDAMLG